jgi:hypothetical protein
MILTTAQQARLRTHPHLTKLNLSIYQPTTVMACRVFDASITKGERWINYNTLTVGNYNLVQNGMTLYVGTTAGAFDKGTVRIRSADAVRIIVAENSHIEWADGDYLTVVNFYEINAVYPRIIQDPADATKTIWYKDYDIAYTNQNSILGSFINMGPHHAGFIENGSCDVYYSASGTYNLLGETLSYHWFFEGASTTGSSVNTPGLISYATPGQYTTRLIVSGTSSGASDVSYRHVSIYNKPGEGTVTPVQKWELVDFTGSRDQGGYTAKVRLYELETASVLRDGTLIVIFAEDWYGDTLNKQSYGGNALGRSSIVFVGYVLKGTIQYNYRDSFIEFDAGSPSEVMKLSENFTVSIQYSTDPSTATSDPDIPSGWVTVLDMDVRRALYHYLRWHSTALMTTDFQFVGTDRYLQYFDADRTSIFDAVQSAMKGILVGSAVCDRQGKLWAERDLIIEPTLFQTNYTLEKPDWIGDVSIEEDRSNQTSYIEMGGVSFDGVNWAALLSEAPGPTPSYRGNVERIQGLALLNQAELNTIVGRVFAQRNSTYPSIEMNLSGNYRNLDIAPQESVPVTISATDTIRGISFSSKTFIPNRMEWKYDPSHETFLPKLSLAERVTGSDGETMTIPAVPDPNGYDVVPPPVVPPVVPAFPTWGLGSSLALPVWTPMLTANVGGVDVYPDAGNLGGVEIAADAYSRVTIGFPAHNTGQVTIELLFYQLGNGGTAQIDAELGAYNTSDGSSANLNTATQSFTINNNRFRKSTPLVLNWSGEPDVTTIFGRYDFVIVGSATLYILGIILTWTK